MADQDELDVVAQWLVVDFVQASNEAERDAIYQRVVAVYDMDERLAVTQMVISMLCDIFDGMRQSNPMLGRLLSDNMARAEQMLPPRP